jgi:hypothetical protein
MNNKIEQLILNVQGLCLDRMRLNNEISIDTLFEDSFLKVAIPALYEADLEDNLKNNFVFEDLKKEIFKLFEKKKPTQALAEDYLESWLNSSIRTNPENRFSAYKKLLNSEKKGSIIEQMDADTYKILDSCHNPQELKYEWDRRGLVYGHVQSGKTANYIGLINRAFDAGYKIIIVLTGVTEDLRVQTQRRIDEGVVGQREQVKIGIGTNAEFQKLDEIIPATSIHKDLMKNDDLRGSVISTRNKSIWVIKKNKAVLENLILWLDKQRSNGPEGKINNVPFLVIDDEADNASIQSMSKKDYDDWGMGQSIVDLDKDELTKDQELALKKAQDRIIKAINRNIRVALSLMAHKTFVAYTATPYSIINQSEKDLTKTVKINDKEFTIDANTDLFPAHFIIPISAGNKYMGIDRIFNTDKFKKLPVVVNLSINFPNEDLDNDYFPTKKGRSYSFQEIPISLEDAIFNFIIGIKIRKFRGHEDYNSLLIHTSHLTDNADYLATKIESFIIKLQENILSNSGGYLSRIQFAFDEMKKNSKNELFNEYFGQQYEFPKQITKEDVLDILLSKKDNNNNYKFAPFEIVSYHSSNRSDLNHKNHSLRFDLRDSSGQKRFKNYIVVGGNRLSRGLTIEGLITSYFIRNSTRQDSLYQMARWFGYRVGFEDLVKIYMPHDQILWFEGVYKLERDLRKDFEENNDDDIKMLPRDAMIKLAFHTYDDQHIPNNVRKKFPAICDPNKLRNTRKQPISFVGTTKTNRIINDKNVQAKNMLSVLNIFKEMKSDPNNELFNVTDDSVPHEIRNNKNINYTNVNYSWIIKLLENYEAEKKIKSDIFSLINFIKENKVELEKWSLVLVNRGTKYSESLKGDFYEDQDLKKGMPLKIVSRDKSATLESNNSLNDTIYFRSILDQQKDNIFDIVNEKNYSEYSNPNNNKSDLAKEYRNKSKKPLLLIYPTYTSLASDIEVFPLIYCFIPHLEFANKVSYIIRNK